MPRIEIIEKEVLYRSEIHRTPLLDPTTIDIRAVESLVNDEYNRAGIKPRDIKTGAVIITGETATKSNAQEMVHTLSDHAGEFLVATAGPDLEGIIAAKGSGAYEYSKRTGKVIANIDIGGGTANAAVYKSGRLCGTCTLHIGGRLIEFVNDEIKSISPPVKKLLMQQGKTISVGDSRNTAEIKALTDFMAETIAMMLDKTIPEGSPLLLGHSPNWEEKIDAIMFSGGVGECIYRYEPVSAIAVYNDIGETLAQSLKESDHLAEWPWIKPEETVRATVLGAGTQTTEISGATISVEDGALPQRNLPVYQIDFGQDLENGLRRFPDEILKALEIYDPYREGHNFALYLTGMPYLGFKAVQQLAASILAGVEQKPDPQQPIVIVLESDHAKVLGQTLILQDSRKTIVCIDQIKVEHGDYIDIGTLLQTNVVPVVVKTLTFEH